MKKILIFIIVTLIICIIFVVNSTLCKQFYRGQQDKQSIVHFMLYSEMGSMDEKEPRMNKIYADMYEGTWDTESGNVGVDLKNRIFRMQGSTYFNIVKMWDGNDNYFISTYLDNSIIEKTSQRNVNMLDEQNKEGMVYGDGYRFFIDEHQICHFNTQEKDQDIIFSSLEHIFNYNGEQIPSSDLIMLGSHFDGNNLYILWGFLKGNTMVCSTLSLREKSINWSDMIKIPEKYSNLFVYNSANECHFVSDKFYLGAGDTIICFDIKTYQISGLERITDKLDNLIPQTKRWTMGNQIVPAQIVGFNKDMIIASLEYVSIESPNKYDILFVIKKDRLSGIFCWDYIDNIFTATTYNKKMHKQTTESFEDISDLNVLIKWQNMKYST